MILKRNLKNIVLPILGSLLLIGISDASVTEDNANEVDVFTESTQQNCEVYDGSGIATAADMNKVKAFCQSWLKAALMKGDNWSSAIGVKIAVDAQGNALAVWYQNDLKHNSNIWTNRYTRRSGWGSPELIETDNSGNAHAPQIAITPSGDAFVIWIQSDGSRANLWANRYTVTHGWGQAQPIESNDMGNACFPKIATDAAGNAMAVWQLKDGSQSNIWANRYTVTSGWGRAELIQTDNTGNAEYPDIAMDTSGNAFAGWSQLGGSVRNVWVNHYTNGKGWGMAELIETDNAGNASAPDIAVDAAGNAIAVWRQFDGTRYNLLANHYTIGSGWGNPQLIETDNTGDALFQKIAIDTAGNALVVWSQHDGTRANIWSNHYTKDLGWGSAELIETNNAGNAWISGLAFNPDGNALAVWDQSDGDRFKIWVNQYKAGTGWTGAKLFEATNIANIMIQK